MAIDGRWVIQDDGTILTPGVDYGPKGLKFIEQIGKCIIAHQPGHMGWVGRGEQQYYGAEWLVVYVKQEDGFGDGGRLVQVLQVEDFRVGRKRKASLEQAREMCRKATKSPKTHVHTLKMEEKWEREDAEAEKERKSRKLRKSKPFAEEQSRKAKTAPKSDLTIMMQHLKQDGAKKRDMLKEYNARIREPDLFLETDEGFGVGYWRVPAGIWKAEKYKNGYHPNRGVLLENTELVHLMKLLEGDIRHLDDKEGVSFFA